MQHNDYTIAMGELEVSKWIQIEMGISNEVPTKNIEAKRPESEHSAMSLRLRMPYPRQLLVFVAKPARAQSKGWETTNLKAAGSEPIRKL